MSYPVLPQNNPCTLRNNQAYDEQPLSSKECDRESERGKFVGTRSDTLREKTGAMMMLDSNTWEVTLLVTAGEQ